jgi:hypothetical protein
VAEEIRSGYGEGRGVYSVVTTLGAGHSGEEGGLVLALLKEVVPCVGLEAEAWGTGLHEAEEDHLDVVDACEEVTVVGLVDGRHGMFPRKRNWICSWTSTWQAQSHTLTKNWTHT